MPASSVSWVRRLILTAIVAIFVAVLAVPAAQAAPPSTSSLMSSGYGFWYTVQPGDTWTSLARRTGIPIADLQAANPDHMHPPFYWLYVGHQLWIPRGPARCDYWYTVQRGDSWSKVARRTGVPVRALQAANPDKVRPPRYWLYAGDMLWIPCDEPPPPVCQYHYRVQWGDSWAKVSRKTGVPVHLLQQANPNKVRPPRYWLYAGEVLCIPDP